MNPVRGLTLFSKRIKKARTPRAILRDAIMQLESRTLLSSVVVNTAADSIDAVNSSVVSLRDAINLANASTTATTITFSPTVFAASTTITLSHGVLELTDTKVPTTITGPTAALTVSGNALSGVFKIDTGVTASMTGVDVTKGNNGGIYNDGTFTLTDASVSNSSSNNQFGGGGIYNDGSIYLTLDTVSHNTTTGYGGGLYNSGNATIDRSTFASNDSGAGFSGGGIYNHSILILTNSTLSGNSAGSAGGLYTDNFADLTNCTIADNTADDKGGGINSSLTLNLTNCTIVGNTAICTCGGGIYVATGAPTIGNTIVAGNNPGNQSLEGAADVDGNFGSEGNNLIGEFDFSTGWVGSDLLGTAGVPLDPMLSALGNFGGPTQTFVPLTGSPAIDAGNNQLIPGLATDQRGLTRIVNKIVDIGSTEVGGKATLTATISGTVYKDTNDNGKLDSGETGLAGVTVYIDANKDGALDGGDPTAVSSSSGAFSFPGLAAGTYRIREVTPSGYNETQPTGAFYDITVASGGTSTGSLFGNAPVVVNTGSITGEVFTDTNANGKLDSGETGMSGVTVYIDTNNNGKLDSGETHVTSTSTGSFSFGNLAAGTYHIREVVPTGDTETDPSALSYTVTLTTGQKAAGYLFGNAVPMTASITGEVFVDANSNGHLDSGEVGMPGVTVYLDKNNDGKLDTGDTSLVSASNGSFSFTHLAAGTYYLREVVPAGNTETDPSAFVYSVKLAVGQNAGFLFGNVVPVVTTASISGEVFTDTNANGKLDSGETGMSGVTVYIDANNNGKLDSGETHVTSTSTGSFSFGSLPAGTYHIREVVPTGDTDTDPTALSYTLTLTAGQKATGLLFGNAVPMTASITGEVFVDANANGQLDSSESGMPGVTVYLDNNDDGKLDAGDTSLVSGSNGSFSFTHLAAGTYHLREVLPAGYTETDPTAFVYTVKLAVAQNAGFLFGNHQNAPTMSSISGLVFDDFNADGKVDGADVGFAGITVYLDTNNNDKLDPGETSVVTGSNGDFSFGNLPPGTYHVREVAKTGYFETVPGGAYNITLTGTSVTGYKFGLAPIVAEDIVGGTISGQEGRTASGTVATFTCADTSATAADFAASLSWGDGIRTSATIVADGNGHFHVTASHAYYEEQSTPYPLKITVTAINGANITAMGNADIASSPLDEAVGLSQTVTGGKAFTATLGTFRDQDSLNHDATDYTGTINWGDGTTSSATFVRTNAIMDVGTFWNVIGTHTYATTPKVYNVTLTFDDTGNIGTFPSTVVKLTITVGEAS